MNGSVYILKIEGQNAYKIGMTIIGLADRIRDLQTGCPYKIVAVFHGQVEDESSLERYLHTLFCEKKIRGEWFCLSELELSEAIQVIQENQLCFCLNKASKSNYDSIDFAVTNTRQNTKKREEQAKTTRILFLESELTNWYKWLPSKAEVLLMMEDLDAGFCNFTYLVKHKLKKTEAFYNRKAKGAIVRLLLDSNRTDLMQKFQIDPAQFPFLD